MKPGDEVGGRYRLDDLQGRGPMSEVWRAHDGTLDRTVALKLLSPTADLERFRREARALATLAHENVMRVFDYGEDEAGPFMALEWLPGGTLEDRLSEGPLPPGETHRVAEGIAAGLAHLHARGFVHRDLKPANVLFDEEGRPKLGDFGLARRAAGSGTLTEAGTVLGTAAYISPEQATGEPAGPASDVYSFGVILFRMLTGVLPFVADDALALVDLHRHAPPPAVESLQPEVPPALATLTAAALRKDPAQRPADGGELLRALAVAPASSVALSATEATQVLPLGAAERGHRFGRRSVAIGLALVLLAAAGGVLAWIITRPTPTPAGVLSNSTRDGPSRSGTSRQTRPGTTRQTKQDTTTTAAHSTTSATTSRTTTTAPTTTAPATTTVPTTTTIPTTTATTAGTTAVTATTAPGTHTSRARARTAEGRAAPERRRSPSPRARAP